MNFTHNGEGTTLFHLVWVRGDNKFSQNYGFRVWGLYNLRCKRVNLP